MKLRQTLFAIACAAFVFTCGNTALAKGKPRWGGGGSGGDSTGAVLLLAADRDSYIAGETALISTISLNWMRPPENVDGTALNDLAAYRIYYGQHSRSYDSSILIDDPDRTAYSFPASSGEYFIGMTAIDADGNESGLSNEVIKLAP